MKGKKRYIGILLCICMLGGILHPAVLSTAKSEMTSYVNSPSYIWNGKNTQVYYADNFSDEVGYQAALGSYAENRYAMVYDAQNKKLCYPSDSALEANIALFNGLPDASFMTDYTIEAKINKGQLAQYVALISYGSEDDGNRTNGYEFALVARGSNTAFRLGYRKNGTFTTLKDTEGKDLLITVTQVSGLGISGTLVGEDILLRMTTITNDAGNVELKCYAKYGDQEVVVFECVADGSVTDITCGAPGIRTHSKGTTIDNLSITHTSSDTIFYADDFVTRNKYQAALGDYAQNKYTMTYDAENKKLCYPSDSTIEANVALFKGLVDASAMKNYTVEAKVNKGQLAQYVALIAYGSEDNGYGTNGYEFALVARGENTAFRLGYRKNGTFTTLKDTEGKDLLVTVTQISDLGISGTLVGEDILLRMTAITNNAGNVELDCYATYAGREVLIFECVADGTITGITCGAPGFRTHSKGTTIDNVQVTQTVDNNILYGDSFSSWSGYEKSLGSYADSTYKMSWSGDGKYLYNQGSLTNAFFYGLDNVTQLQNYKISADVTVLSNTRYMSLVAYGAEGTNENSHGYEFSLVQGNYFRLGYRNDTSLITLKDPVYVQNANLNITDNAVGKEIMMGMSAQTNESGKVVLKCYATYNGKTATIFEYETDETTTFSTSGVPGVKNGNPNGIIDNICVEKIATNTNTPGDPDTPSDPDAPNVPEGEAGTLPFTESFDEIEKLKSRWNIGSKVTIQDAQVLLGDRGASTDKMYLTGVLDADKWTNYVYEADVTPLEKAIPGGAQNSIAAIVAAVNENQAGYEFGVMYTPATDKYEVRLYDRVTKVVLATKSYDFQFGVPLRMKIEIVGDTIQCYIDGEKVFPKSVQVLNVNQLTGTIGILVGGKQALFDNLSVCEYKEDTGVNNVKAPAANAEGIYYYDSFSKGVRLADNKWDTKVLDIAQESLLLTGNPGIHYLTGDKGYLLLRDYTVSAKAVVDTENDVKDKTIIGAVVARTEGESSGYEFGICYSGKKAYVRLYDRTAKRELARKSNVELELGKEYLLTMVCEGNVITCYLDNQSIISVVNNTNTYGTAGVRTIGTVYYDDFTIAVPEYAQKFGYVSNGESIVGSPNTGDNGESASAMVTIMGVSVFYMLSVTIVRKKRKGAEQL